MRKIINSVKTLWAILFFAGVVVTWPVRKLVWKPLRFALRCAGFGFRLIRRIIGFVIGLAILAYMVPMAWGFAERLEMTPDIGCPGFVVSLPKVGEFCDAYQAAGNLDEDFDENIVQVWEGGPRPSIFRETARPAPEAETAVVATPTPETVAGTLPKCDRCKAELVDVGGDRGVIDGDTVRILYGSHEFKLRLRGVDAYEMGQMCGPKGGERDCGRVSRDGLVGQLEGGYVFFTYEDDGKYYKPSHDRYVADVYPNPYVSDEYRFGEILVMGGYAVPIWDFLRGGESDRLRALHEDAKAYFFGVYREGEEPPLSPGAYRRQARGR